MSRSKNIYFLKLFMASENIIKLNKQDDISFNTFLNFIEQHFPQEHIIDLFNYTYLDFLYSPSREASFFYKFIAPENQKNSILIYPVLNWPLKRINFIEAPLSALTMLPNDLMVFGTCFGNTFSGKISLYTKECRFIKLLVSEPATALAITSDGHILSAISDDDGLNGEIVLRDKEGQRIRTLLNEPATALAITMDGNILRGLSNREGTRGKIDLLDFNGQHIKTLVDEPSRALAITASGNILSGLWRLPKNNSDQHAYIEGNMVLRAPDGQYIETLSKEPTTGIGISSEGMIVTISCDAMREHGSIQFYQPSITKISPVFSMNHTKQIVSQILMDKTAMACIQFHKGYLFPDDTVSLLCRLPKDILKIIYSYVFSFSGMEQKGTVYHQRSNASSNTEPLSCLKKISISEAFATKVLNLKFFKQPMVPVTEKMKEEIQKKTKAYKRCIII